MRKQERDNIASIIEGLDTVHLRILAKGVSRVAWELNKKNELSKINAESFEHMAVKLFKEIEEIDRFVDFLEIYT